jgi:hypothetical protein
VGAFLLLYLIHFWWWEFRLQAVQRWTFPLYFFISMYAVIQYLVCVLLFSDAELIVVLCQAQHKTEAQGRPNEAPVLLADFAKELLNQRLSASVQVVQWIDLRRLNYRAQLDKFAIALASRMDMNRHT